MFVVLIDARQTHSLCSLASCVLHTVHLIQQIFFYAVAQLHVAALDQHQPSRTGGKYIVTVVCFLLQCYGITALSILQWPLPLSIAHK
jgi:hypothetical protein